MRKGLLIAMVISLVLCSCGTTGKEITEVKEPVTKETINMYISEKETIHSSQESVLWLDAQAVGDTIYYLADETKKSSTGISVFKKTADADPVKIVNLGSRSVEEFAVDPKGNIYALSYESNAFYWRKYNAEGEELFRKKAEGAGRYLLGKGNMKLGGSPAASEEGICILSSEGVCLIWDDQGEAIAQLEMEWYEPNMRSTEFGIVKGAEAIYVYHEADNSIFLQAVDFETGMLKETVEIEVPDGANVTFSYWNQLYNGYENGIYIADFERLYLYNDKTGNLSEVLQWTQQGVGLNQNMLKAFGKDESGKMYFYEYDFQTLESAKITVEKKETTRYLLTLGCIGNARKIDGGEYVTEFNRTQDEILISYKEYANVEELQRDLAVGVGPDILELSEIDITEYAKKGILEELDPYLETGDGLKREDILPTMLEGMSVDDKVYFLAPSFTIWTMIIENEEAAADGMTSTEFLTMETGKGYLCDTPKDILFETLLERDIDAYVDWQKRKCSFDDGRFAAFLEALKAANLPEKYIHESLHKEMEEGNYQAFFRGIPSLYDSQEVHQAMSDIALITGLPDSEGNLEYKLSFANGMLGINSASSKKDIAWEYLEYHLQEYAANCEQFSDVLSVLINTFEEQLHQKASSKFKYIATNPYTGVRGPLRFQYTDADRNVLKGMIENVKKGVALSGKGMIGSIINEEVEAFFNDESSAQEVAAAIQERVSAYMKE